jgi:hypothetical protein
VVEDVEFVLVVGFVFFFVEELGVSNIEVDLDVGVEVSVEVSVDVGVEVSVDVGVGVGVGVEELLQNVPTYKSFNLFVNLVEFR